MKRRYDVPQGVVEWVVRETTRPVQATTETGVDWAKYFWESTREYIYPAKHKADVTAAKIILDGNEAVVFARRRQDFSKWRHL